MSFASDTFSGSTGVELSAYNAAWSKQSGYTQIAVIGANGQYANHIGQTEYAVYQHSGTPASADYSVFASIFRLSGSPGGTGPQMGPCGRMQSGDGTFYVAIYLHGSTKFQLLRFNSKTAKQLGSDWTHTLTTTPETVELRMSGNDISVYVDSVLRIGPVTDSSPITTAGKAGLLLFDMRQTGVADTGGLDDWSAVDAGGGGSSALSLTGGLLKSRLIGGRLIA